MHINRTLSWYLLHSSLPLDQRWLRPVSGSLHTVSSKERSSSLQVNSRSTDIRLWSESTSNNRTRMERSKHNNDKPNIRIWGRIFSPSRRDIRDPSQISCPGLHIKPPMIENLDTRRCTWRQLRGFTSSTLLKSICDIISITHRLP